MSIFLVLLCSVALAPYLSPQTCSLTICKVWSHWWKPSSPDGKSCIKWSWPVLWVNNPCLRYVLVLEGSTVNFVLIWQVQNSHQYLLKKGSLLNKGLLNCIIIIHLVVNLKLTKQTNCESFISGLFKLITKYLVILYCNVTLFTLTLFSIHFLRVWKGEFV